MSVPKTIARAEMAQLLNISLTKLLNIIRYTDAKVPEPVGKSGSQLIYDREVILAWIATKPLENITWQQRTKKPATVEHTADLIKAFLSGNIGLSKAQRNRNQLRKVIAKHRPARTQRVEVSGSDEYAGSRDAWAGLV